MMAGLFHGIDNPVPVAGCLQSNFAASWQGSKVFAIEVVVVIDSHGPGSIAVLIDRDEDGEVFVSVTPNDWLHGASYVRSAYLRRVRERFHRFTPKREL
jgi:hypothetical protein